MNINICNPATPNQWIISLNKTFSILNTLTLKGLDNQIIDFSGLPQGTQKLGTAALASAQAFQPSGGALNLVGIDISSTITNGTGSKTFSVATGLGFITGMVVTAIETANPAVYMQGSVTSYSGTTLVVNMTYSQGSHTGTGWTIQISGPQGPQGTPGTGSVPIGTLEFGDYASLPTNYLWASGPSFTACVSNSTYATLYAAIGDTDTAINGCVQGTTFGIPNMSGVFPLGTSGSYALGAKGGSATHTQAAGEVGPVTVAITITDPGHLHSLPNQTASPSIGAGVTQSTATGTVSYTGTAYTGITATGTGGNSSPTPMNIMNPYSARNWVIRFQ
jgi:hypothetical protein